MARSMAGRRERSSNENGNGSNQEVTAEEDGGPACQPCRKKKSKCSRTQPCSHCDKSGVECVYDDRKIKPGMRTGAMESLTQRVVALEHMFLGQGVLWQQVWSCLNTLQPVTPMSPSSLPPIRPDGENLRDCTNRLKATLSSLSNGGVNGRVDDRIEQVTSTHKRRRIEVEAEPETPKKKPLVAAEHESVLPADDLVDDLVEIYFEQIHPWIPILHVRQFRERMKIPSQRQKLTTIFHAIVSLCSRLSNDPRLVDSGVNARKCRQIVVLQSMESFSVENLQALVICAFDTIGSGRGPSAWSIVGSMTRTVEQLQLSVEENDDPDETRSAEFLMQRMAFLKPCKSWLEREERRRVFWNVFLMDRFCSIATGWNVSLTSADVKRRLPCEGALWEAGTPLQTPTPYFGISDAAAATPVMNTDSRQERADQASIGAFAYCIEATESLSLVTMFFLQHAVDISNFHDVQMWLMRFKELDLRLIQWKIFLPEKWREASVTNADGILDPNLTLAHITHNTAVGLLHQGIAYPSPQWQRTSIRLPSSSSAETCLAAASEIAIIAEKFLLGSTILTNPQFAFCLFISGRMLLAHSSYYRVELSADFDSLTNSLLEISKRWNGSRSQVQLKDTKDNLASKFAARLIQAKNDGPGVLDIRKAAYSEEGGQRTAAASPEKEEEDSSSKQTPPANPRSKSRSLNNSNRPAGETALTMSGLNANGFGAFDDRYTHPGPSESSPDSISLAFPPLPLSFQPQNSSSMQSPTTSHAHLPVGDIYQADMESYDPSRSAAGFQDATIGFGTSGEDYENLMSFFQYPFLPSQRISTFSNTERLDTSGTDIHSS